MQVAMYAYSLVSTATGVIESSAYPWHIVSMIWDMLGAARDKREYLTFLG